MSFDSADGGLGGEWYSGGQKERSRVAHTSLEYVWATRSHRNSEHTLFPPSATHTHLLMSAELWNFMVMGWWSEAMDVDGWLSCPSRPSSCISLYVDIDRLTSTNTDAQTPLHFLKPILSWERMRPCECLWDSFQDPIKGSSETPV